MTPDRIEQVKAHGAAGVANAFGFELGQRGPRSRFVTPCPACGAATRHPTRGDRRGAVGLTPEGDGWRCHQCGAGGSAYDLAAWAILGRAPTRGDVAAVLDGCAAHGLCDGRAGQTPGPVRPVPPPPRTPEAAATPMRPDAAELAALWGACQPVTADAEATAWLRSRGLDPAAVEDFGLARALPVGAEVPRWARFRGRPWTASSHRLLVPMYGPTGQVESVHARALTPAGPGAKAASPAGASVAGLVMATPLGRLMLAGCALGDGTPASVLVAKVGLWVAEGLPDFLTLAIAWSDADDQAPAVIGVIAGSWTPAVAARVPDGCAVVIATDPDPAGEKYAARIVATLEDRVRAGALPAPRRWSADRRAA